MRPMRLSIRSLQNRRHCAAPADATPTHEAALSRGVSVQIKTPVDGAWASGYQVFSAHPDGGYLVRRLSDDSLLPRLLAAAELRLDPVPLPAVTPSPSSPPAAA